MRWILVLLLWTGFFFLFIRLGRLKTLQRLMQKTKSGMEEAARRRLLLSRSNLSKLQKEEGIWFLLERQLCYSGLKRRFPFLGVEVFMLFVILISSGLFLMVTVLGGLFWGIAIVGCFLAAVWLVITLGKAAEMHSVNDNLMKFLDFLGNYSVTAGNVISVFGQISKYMDEPIRSALEQCCVEAQTTGDVGMALLSMADQVEHPQFKELMRNIEVSSRYSADFSVLVAFCRRSLREFLKNGQERKSLLREAGINMVLLLGMSVFALVTVNGLLGVSVWTILLHTWPGKIAMGIVGLILLLFGMQVYHLEG